MSDADVLIIGAGPAGTTTAAFLAQAGLSVQIVERAVFPRFVIGESLIPSVMDVLDQAGLLAAVQARGFQTKPGAVFMRGKDSATIRFSELWSEGWDHTWHVDRADFDHTLARAVADMGVAIDFGVEVTAVDTQPSVVVSARDADGNDRTYGARFVIDASGYGRVLADLYGLDTPSEQPLRAAMFCHVRGDRRPAGEEGGNLWVCTGNAVWSWFIPLADGRTSVGAITTPDVMDAVPGNEEARLRALVGCEDHAIARLEPAELLFPPRSVRAYARSIQSYHGPNYCLVGHATEFIDPVLSSGIALALESARCAASLVVRELGGEAVDWDREYAGHMHKGMAVFRDFVEAWYDGTFATTLFAPTRPNDVQRQINSILAGYVWDDSNPFIQDVGKKLRRIARKIRQADRLGLSR